MMTSSRTQFLVSLLGQAIRIGRKERGWSETELAKRAGCSRPTVQHVERGELGSAIGTVFELASLCGVPLFEEEHRSERRLEAVASLLQQLPAVLPKRVGSRQRGLIANDF